MDYNREEDILYLAHQLWEESDDPTAPPQTYWTQAALQVLAQQPKMQRKTDCGLERIFRKPNVPRQQSYAQHGFTVHIDMGVVVETNSVAVIKRCGHSEVAIHSVLGAVGGLDETASARQTGKNLPF